MGKEIFIGWSEADITPVTDKFISLSGQYYERLTKEIHSNLKTVAVAFSSGDQQFIEIGMDNVAIPQSFFDFVAGEIKKIEPEIKTENVFINVIHTHSGPSTRVSAADKSSSVFRATEKDDIYTPEEYVAFAGPIVAENAVKAWRSRKKGGISRAFGRAGIGHCRRPVFATGKAEMYGDTTRRDFIGLEAGEDSGIEMLFTHDETGKRTGMLLNVACPSQVMESTYKVSSDFAGATRELLKKEYGEDFCTIYQISPAGCQSPRDLVRHYTTEPDFWHADGVVEHSNRLLKAVREAVVFGDIDYAPVFKSVNVPVSLPRRRASYQDYVAAKAELAALEAIMPEAEAFEAFCAETHANEKIDGPGPYDSKLHHFVLIKNAQAVIARYEDQDVMPELSFDMNVVRIGDVAIANNPFELYLYFGQIIKARTRCQQTFLVQLACGANCPAGYLPSPEAEKFGGYGGLIINGQVGSDGGYKLADVTVDAINALFE